MNKPLKSAILDKPTDDPERYRAPALDKGLDILELLADQPDGLTRGEIVKALDRGPSEIYRMLERLVARRYVLRSPAGDRYSMSLKMFDLAHRYPPTHRLVAQALPVMDRYAKEAEQACHLGVYDRGNVQIVAQVNNPSAISMTVRPGTRVNLLDTGSGQVLLACESDARRKQMLAEHVALDGEVLIPPDELEHMLEAVRATGYRQRESLQYFGVIDISCPILGPYGHALAVLTTPYIRRIDRHAIPSLDRARELMLQAARDLSLLANAAQSA